MNAPLQELRLSADELIALLVTMMWADTRMTQEQVRAVAAVAAVLRYPVPQARLATPEPYDPLTLRDATIVARGMMFALAAFVGAADRRLHVSEQRLLTSLQQELDLDTPTAERLRHLAWTRAHQPISPTSLLGFMRDAALETIDANQM